MELFLHPTRGPGCSRRIESLSLKRILRLAPFARLANQSTLPASGPEGAAFNRWYSLPIHGTSRGALCVLVAPVKTRETKHDTGTG